MYLLVIHDAQWRLNATTGRSGNMLLHHPLSLSHNRFNIVGVCQLCSAYEYLLFYSRRG